jgi:hypothetical protein
MYPPGSIGGHHVSPALHKPDLLAANLAHSGAVDQVAGNDLFGI